MHTDTFYYDHDQKGQGVLGMLVVEGFSLCRSDRDQARYSGPQCMCVFQWPMVGLSHARDLAI